MSQTVTKKPTQKKRNTLNVDVGKRRLEKVISMADELGITKTQVVERAIDEMTSVTQRKRITDTHELISANLFVFGKIFNGTLLYLMELAQKVGELWHTGQISEEAAMALLEAMGNDTSKQIEMDTAINILPETQAAMERYRLSNPALWRWDALEKAKT